MSTEQDKFFELQTKLEKKQISKMEFFTKAETLIKSAKNKKDIAALLLQAKTKNKSV